MAVATRVGRTERYILREDRNSPEDQQTVFHLKQLNARVRSMIQDDSFDVSVTDEDGEVRARFGSTLYNAVRFGVEGFDNLRDPDNPSQCVECKKMRWRGQDALDGETMDYLAGFINELGSRIIALNKIDQDDEGNSRSSPGSSPGG